MIWLLVNDRRKTETDRSELLAHCEEHIQQANNPPFLQGAHDETQLLDFCARFCCTAKSFGATPELFGGMWVVGSDSHSADWRRKQHAQNPDARDREADAVVLTAPIPPNVAKHPDVAKDIAGDLKTSGRHSLNRFKTSLGVKGAGARKAFEKSGDAQPQRCAPQVLPLTVAQRGIWIGTKISRVGTVFNVAEAIEIHGAVDPGVFVDSIRQLIAEAQTTRANIFEDAAGPHLIIHDKYRGETPFLDFSNDADPCKAARDWMMADVTAPCDMERDALWLGALLKTAPDQFFFFQRAHHIVLDGFAGSLLVARVAEIYNAKIEGRAPPPANFSPLSTLVDLEKQYRTARAHERDRDYWLERLKDFPDPVSFAQGRAPTAGGLARETARLAPETAKHLREMAKDYSCSLPQVLIAMMAAFIHRTTGARDIVLGMPVSARNKAARRVPGMAANGVMLRLNIDPQDNFPALAAQVSREVRRALRHQQYRFEDMRRDLGLTGQHDHITRIAVNIEPFDYNLTFGGARTTAHNLANSSVEDMVMFIYDRGDGAELRIDFDANPSLYSAQELLGHRVRFEEFSRALLDSPDAPLEHLDFLSGEERQKLLALGRGEQREIEKIPAFVLIERRAERWPQSTAIRHDNESLTYKALNARANHLARRLLNAGVGRGDIIALAMERTAQYPVAMLAIAKTGAAFLPLDPCDPPGRLKNLIKDAGAKLTIANAGAAASLGESCGDVWRADECAAGYDSDNITDAERGGPVQDADLAYLIYTSGSTGAPKGVMLHHGGLTNTVCDAIERYPVGPEDKLLAVAAFTFDASVLEIYAALAAGATLVMAPRNTVRDPAALCALMQSESVTFMIATPTQWDMLISSRGVLLQGMKAAVAGEALTSRLARALHDLGAVVANCYGPTEATVQTATAPLGEADLSAPPIGRPVWNTQLYILDDHLGLLPQGVAGELCIAGAGVAHGYLNNKALTEEKFPLNPYDPDGGRLYRTGDLARWREDGALEFLGRRDQQIKLRGIRMEPGEIESALMAQPDVRSAFVDIIEHAKNGKRLAAYVTAKENATLDADSLRDALRSVLPAHAVPSRIFILDAMPVTRNGKIDRNALPKTEARDETGYVAPRTPTEQKLADIFTEMLGLDRIGVEDNFFDLGADSLTAVQLLTEIETKFSTQLSLLSLFDAPTIANLAREMENAEAGDPFDAVFPIRRQGGETPIFCIHSVVGVAWSYAGLLRHLSPQSPVYGLQAKGLQQGDNSALPETIDAMADDYLQEIKAIRPQGPYRLLGWSLGGLVAHSIAAKLEAGGDTVELLGLLDAFPFSPAVNRVSRSEEGALVDIALQFINQPEDALGGRDKTLASLADYMFTAFDVFSMPLVQKAGLGGDALRDRFQTVIANCFRITLEHRPQTIASDIHVFRARKGKTSPLDNVIEHDAGSWRAYTTGAVREYDVPCGHFEMLNAEPLEIIGPAIRDVLR
ncbi:amino acid adenylation domain-containing protein [Hyphococcus sp.]|uniref:amino acid adenylation domain-containing protein n=1 Tax=Hyphococcus sp. TaxID=2038636 RepID=UPI003CCBF2D4